MNIDHTILTVITFVPLAGAVLLAFLPDKGKLMQWGALAITLITVWRGANDRDPRTAVAQMLAEIAAEGGPAAI